MNLAQGIHPNIPFDDYVNDRLTPEAAISASGIKQLLSGSPADFAARSVRLSQWPDFARRSSTRSQDLGTISHSKILGSPCEYHAIRPQDLALPPYNIVLKSGKRKGQPYATWSGGAKEWREEQEAAGVMILDPTDHANIMSAVESMEGLLRRRFGDWPIGDSEVTLIWQEGISISDTMVWCRARLDHYAPQFMTVFDPKFSEKSIDTASLAKTADVDKWGVQAAWYLRGLEALGLGSNFSFLFPVAQLTPPFSARFFRPTETRLQIGRSDCERGLQTFARCMASGEWPDHEEECAPEVSEWELRRYEERELMS